MKKFCLIFLLFYALFNCKAQNNIKAEFDSLALISRAKADSVLLYFGAFKLPKLLYSISEKDYYILIKEEDGQYVDYYLTTDSLGKIEDVTRLNRTNIDDIELSQLYPFEFKNYNLEFITKMPNAKYIRGKSSYFVVKDKYGKRYGEFCLSIFTLPIPIDGQLYGYLVRRLSEQI